MKILCYLGILKEGFSAYSSPVMLISRKLTKDKRVVTESSRIVVISGTVHWLYLKTSFHPLLWTSSVVDES